MLRRYTCTYVALYIMYDTFVLFDTMVRYRGYRVSPYRDACVK